jgi:hypothetical protein
MIFALGLFFMSNSLAKSKTYNLELLDVNKIDLCGKEYQKDVIIAPYLGNIAKSDSLIGFEIVIEYDPEVVQINQQLYAGTMSQFFEFKSATFEKGEIVMEGFVSMAAFPNPVSGDLPLVAFGGKFIGACNEDAYFRIKYFYPIDGFKGTIDTIKDISVKGIIADKPERILGFKTIKNTSQVRLDSTIDVKVGVDLGIMDSVDYWQTRITIDNDSLSLLEVIGTESVIVKQVTKDDNNSYLVDLTVLNKNDLNLTLKINSIKVDSSLVKVKLETVESTECICATNFPMSSFEINNLVTKDTVVKTTVNKLKDYVYSDGIIASRDKQLNVEVYNYTGLLIDTQICDFNKVYDTKQLKQGLYFIKVTDGNKTEILKITNN